MPQRSRYHHLLRGINGLTSSMDREPISDMSHQGMSLSVELPLSGSVTMVVGGGVSGFVLHNL